MPTDFEPIPYRIRIGVTGHRKVADPDAMEALVRAAIDSEIAKLFDAKSQAEMDRVRRKGVTAISYSALSPLAEGADRVAARAILAYPGARLDVVLPLSMDDYLEDFETEESKLEFHELIGESRRPVELRHRRIRDDRHDPDSQAELRKDCYKSAGQYVVDHCDLLIALWDGEPARGRGGTAEIVTYACEQRRPVIRIWDGRFELYNPNDNNGLDATALNAIDLFNCRDITEQQRSQYAASLDGEYFVKPKAAAGIPGDVRELVNHGLFPYYAQASLVAKRNQKRFFRAGLYTYLFSAAAVGCVAAAVLFPALAEAGFGAELALLVAIAWLQWRAHRTHAHQTWIENRFLTERLRSGIFQAICGNDPRPLDVLPFMGHSLTVNDWTVRVFDEIWNRLPRLPGCSHGECLNLNPYIREAWIGDQIRFHAKKSASERRARLRLAGAARIVLPVTVAAAALHLLFGVVTGVGDEIAHVLHQSLTIIALMFPAVAASLAGMEAHREHLRLEKRSENMAPQLQRLDHQLSSATDPIRFEDLMREADELMLRETQDWLMLMRYVDIRAS